LILAISPKYKFGAEQCEILTKQQTIYYSY
jgi:hypothetical protein